VNIYVVVKPVPDPKTKLTYDPEQKTVIRAGLATVINPPDKNALETGLRLREQSGGRVTVFSLAPPSAGESLKETLAMGADEVYLVSDPVFAGSDTLITALILARAISAIGVPDLVLAGDRTTDSGTSHVPAQLGEWLGLPHLANACEIVLRDQKNLAVKTSLDEVFISYRVTLPAVVSVTRRINRPRLATLLEMVRSRSKPVTLLDAAALNLSPEQTGLNASPTKPGRLLPARPVVKEGTIMSGTVGEMAQEILNRLQSLGYGPKAGGGLG